MRFTAYDLLQLNCLAYCAYKIVTLCQSADYYSTLHVCLFQLLILMIRERAYYGAFDLYNESTTDRYYVVPYDQTPSHHSKRSGQPLPSNRSDEYARARGC